MGKSLRMMGMDVFKMLFFIVSLGIWPRGYCDSDATVKAVPREMIARLTIKDDEIISCPTGCIGIVYIPANIRKIGAKAFFGCREVTSICWNSSIESIGASAFCDCVSLSVLKLPETVKDIGSLAFRGCSGLEFVEAVGVRGIGDGAFSKCGKLRRVVLPENLRSVGSDIFKECNSLNCIDFQGFGVLRMCIDLSAGVKCGKGKDVRLFMSQGRWQVDFSGEIPNGND